MGAFAAAIAVADEFAGGQPPPPPPPPTHAAPPALAAVIAEAAATEQRQQHQQPHNNSPPPPPPPPPPAAPPLMPPPPPDPGVQRTMPRPRVHTLGEGELQKYQSTLRQFMTYNNSIAYPKEHAFSVEELSAITPESIYRWMCSKLYHTPEPGPNDNPRHCLRRGTQRKILTVR